MKFFFVGLAIGAIVSSIVEFARPGTINSRQQMIAGVGFLVLALLTPP